MVEDLVQWLGKQLDEDERIAKAVGYAHIETGEYLWGSKYLLLKGGPSGESKATTEFDCDLAVHVARHDPDRVLREIDAKRRIVRDLEEFETALRRTEHSQAAFSIMEGTAKTLRVVVRTLALAFADRPGYREEWKP